MSGIEARAAPDVATIAPFLDAGHAELAADVSAFAWRELAPLGEPPDDAAARRQARAALDFLGGEGWCRLAVPEAHGGLPGAPDFRACCLVREAVAAVSPLADAVFALQALGSLPITLAGSEELRRRYLPRVASGEWMAGFAMTEPEAGSDVTAICTRARRDGDGYVLDGEKTYISNAGLADFYVVFASTDPDAGGRGLSAFVVDGDAEGLELAEAQVLSSPHPLGRLAFDGCRVPSTHRLGDEGRGLKIGLATLDRLRATVAAAACGLAARALAEARAHAAERRQFDRPLADFQLVQARLADMATELTAARLLTYRAARDADGGVERTTLRSSMAKAYATEAAQRVVDSAVQILGGAGVMKEHPVDRLYRSVRALRIYEGTTEIQKLVIARELGREGG